MIAMKLGPLRFEPIFKNALWGGRRLPDLLGRTPRTLDPIGEAWVLSDHGDSQTEVLDGPFRGWTLRRLIAVLGDRLLGTAWVGTDRFPLLLKFIDAREPLSVQVHPNDTQARQLLPNSPDIARGKTEAWVVLRAGDQARLWAGLKDGIDERAFRDALLTRTVPETLHSFAPTVGDCLLLSAGTMHAIGSDLLLFEVQQTSDITYRLYDWDRIDVRTGNPRELHIESGLACTDFRRGPCRPVVPIPERRDRVRRERLIDCEHFRLWRWSGNAPFRVGCDGECRIIIGIDGRGQLESDNQTYLVRPGDAWLLPAETGATLCRPSDHVTLLECGLPRRETVCAST